VADSTREVNELAVNIERRTDNGVGFQFQTFHTVGIFNPNPNFNSNS